MSNEILQAIKVICEEKNLSVESVIETIEAAMAAAYRKDFAEKNQNIKVVFDAKTGNSKVYDVKVVVPDADLEAQEAAWEEQHARREAGEEITAEDEVKRFNPKTEIMLADAKKIKKGLEVGEEITTELKVPAEYGRMAAQTAKQVIIQRLREAERENVFANYKDKVGIIVTGTVQRFDGRAVVIDLGQAQALMTPEEQIRNERYMPGSRFKFYIVAVEMKAKGPEIIVSRAHAELVRQLFAQEVPEVSAGTVIIKEVAREAGSRTKVAVSTEDPNIDPVGSCVGQRGTRVQTVIAELGGEKIDIIEWSDDTELFITQALSPAKVISVELQPETKVAVVKVPEDQLSLAIGRSGQNVRLASKLTGWKIDIASPDGTLQGMAEPGDETASVSPENIVAEDAANPAEEVAAAPKEEAESN
ncbi:MAG: transcription termination factor NusA [Candidatus Komeilibacteria bacterium]